MIQSGGHGYSAETHLSSLRENGDGDGVGNNGVGDSVFVCALLLLDIKLAAAPPARLVLGNEF